MGYFSELQVDIMEMAKDLGDATGEDADTIMTISRVLEVAPEEVEYILNSDYDQDPREYAERSADLDAEFYGEYQ